VRPHRSADPPATRVCTGVPAASNYAPGIKPQAEVAELGYAQNLWLFGPKHEITEVGTMNFFCLWRNKDGGTPRRARAAGRHAACAARSFCAALPKACCAGAPGPRQRRSS